MIKDLEKKIIRWAEDRGIYQQSTIDSRFEKIMEEILELEEAYKYQTSTKIQLEAGDVIVTLINFLQPIGLSLESCLEAAYNKIKNRTGRMIDGTFVKD